MHLPQLKKNASENNILKISSTIVIPFLLARLSKNFLVIGGWAQYCNAKRNIVTRAAADSVSVLAATADVAPPMMAIGLTFRLELDVTTAFGPYFAANLAAK